MRCRRGPAAVCADEIPEGATGRNAGKARESRKMREPEDLPIKDLPRGKG